MSELNDKPAEPRQDFERAAQSLYMSASAHSWFMGLIHDEDNERLVLQSWDVPAASEWCKGSWQGWTVMVVKGNAQVRRGAGKNEGAEMVS